MQYDKNGSHALAVYCWECSGRGMNPRKVNGLCHALYKETLQKYSLDPNSNQGQIYKKHYFRLMEDIREWGNRTEQYRTRQDRTGRYGTRHHHGRGRRERRPAPWL